MAQLKYWDGTAWVTAIVGAQGPTGATGATGAAGAAGTNGTNGTNAVYDTDQAVISMQVFG